MLFAISESFTRGCVLSLFFMATFLFLPCSSRRFPELFIDSGGAIWALFSEYWAHIAPPEFLNLLVVIIS